MKKEHLIRFCNGEEMPLRELENGTFACPICGSPWPYPPYTPATEQNARSCPAMGDVCDCDVEFGVDEGCADYAPVGWMHRLYAKFRTRWLDQGGWNKQQLDQLEHNLGITEDQARDDAQRLKSGTWNL